MCSKMTEVSLTYVIIYWGDTMQIGSLIMIMNSIGEMMGLFLLFSLSKLVVRGMSPALVVCNDSNWLEDRSVHPMYDHIV